MNNFSTNKEILSTPERKKKYIQSWLEESPFVETSLPINFAREVTPEPTERCSPKTPTSTSKLEQNQSASTHVMSPVLGGKRIAGSPIIGGHRKSKRMKLTKKSMKYTKESEPLVGQINLESTCDKTLIIENNTTELDKTLIIDNKDTSQLDKTLIIENNDATQLEENNIDNLKKSLYDSTLSIRSEGIVNANSTLTNIDITTDTCKLSDPLQQHASQIIETDLSEEKSFKSSELIVQEINSDSDKTPSDLIEDISSQLIIKTPQKSPVKQFSQVISNPSSDSSDSATEIHISESISTQPNVNFLSLEASEQTGDIDSPSTLNSKLSLSKTTNLLQHVSNNQKRKKNPKKGSLLDSLFVAMAKERSNVNLVRHQLNRKPINIEEKPFILLKILQHLPMINENQLVTCELVEDKMNLLKDLVENKSDFLITIINVPEISCKINASLKPLLKVYQPWTILDSNQLLLHISRFIAIPTDSAEESEINSGSSNAKSLNVIHRFNCPCINSNTLSYACKSKFQDGLWDITKIILDDK